MFGLQVFCVPLACDALKKCKPTLKTRELAREKQIWQLLPVFPRGSDSRRGGTPAPWGPRGLTDSLPPSLPLPRTSPKPGLHCFTSIPCLWGYLSLWLLMKVTPTCSRNEKGKMKPGVGWASHWLKITALLRAELLHENPNSFTQNHPLLNLGFWNPELGNQPSLPWSSLSQLNNPWP